MTGDQALIRRKESPEVYFALLRGINVGGKNQLPMKELVAMFSAAGCGDARSYIQSGNLLFRAVPSIAARLPGEIAAQVEKRYGYRTPVLLRTSREISKILKENPFLKNGAQEEMLHVMFLADSPVKHDLESLDPGRSSPDEFLIRGREIYLRFSNGMARSKLTNSYFDRKLKTTSSVRNWRTVTKLYEMASDIVL